MATQTDALAQVYARSLYELADEAGGQEKIVEIAAELEEVCEIARADRQFAEFLSSPIIEPKRRGETLRSVFGNRITDLTLRFLLVVNDKGRLGHLEAINSAFDQLVQEVHGRVEIDIFTAAPLGADQLEQIGTRIREVIGREPVLHPYTDDEMIGGVKLRIGDQLVDGSVATRLRRLRQNLMSSGTTAVRERAGRIIEDEGSA